MNIIIDDEQLENLLVSKKKYIGGGWIQAVINIGSGVALFVTDIGADFGTTLPEILQKIIFFVAFLFAVFLIIVGIYQLSKNIGSQCYTCDNLYKDILILNKDKHLYSLIAIKNEFDAFPNKFLLYYDNVWNVYFFPCFQTVDNNEDNIKQKLSSNLKIETTNIVNVKFLKEESNQKKWSQDGKIYKVYDHRFYQVTISEFPDNMKKDIFSIDGRKYKWMTFQEMRNNNNIKKKNEDVVEVFEKYCN